MSAQAFTLSTPCDLVVWFDRRTVEVIEFHNFAAASVGALDFLKDGALSVEIVPLRLDSVGFDGQFS